MSVQTLLEQLLKSGTSLLDPGASAPGRPGAETDWGTFGKGAATGGALGLLLGTRRGRSFGGKALKVGGVVALGALAYRAYTQWQAGQAANAPGAATGAPASLQPAPLQLPAPDADAQGRALLAAMIAAAKSDGHLDERERGLVEAEMNRLEADPSLRAWLEQELRGPIDPAAVARRAQDPRMATEIYLASVLMVDETSFMERAYLDELARQLNLAPELKAQLEAQAVAG
jgi:uncharacterized membrane protein YebE (DUF533 family)